MVVEAEPWKMHTFACSGGYVALRLASSFLNSDRCSVSTCMITHQLEHGGLTRVAIIVLSTELVT